MRLRSNFRRAAIRLAVGRRARCNFAVTAILCQLDLLAQMLRDERGGDVNVLAAITVLSRSLSLQLRPTNRSIPLCTQSLLTLLPSFLRVILFLRRSKCSVRTVCRAVVVRGDNAEIIGGARTQAADVGADVKYMSPSYIC